MPPKARKNAAAIAAAPAASKGGKGGSAKESSSSDGPAEPVKVQLYDGPGLKGALDDCAREVVLNSGFEEDVTVSNIKLGAGFSAVGFALYAQFGPGKFPDNWWQVFWCVVVYLVLTSVLSVYLHYNEADSYLICKPKRGSNRPGLRLASRMDRYDDKYTLYISYGLEQKSNPQYKVVQGTWSVTKFFHADGYLSDDAFMPEVEKLLDALASGGDKKDQ